MDQANGPTGEEYAFLFQSQARGPTGVCEGVRLTLDIFVLRIGAGFQMN